MSRQSAHRAIKWGKIQPILHILNVVFGFLGLCVFKHVRFFFENYMPHVERAYPIWSLIFDFMWSWKKELSLLKPVRVQREIKKNRPPKIEQFLRLLFSQLLLVAWPYLEITQHSGNVAHLLLNITLLHPDHKSKKSPLCSEEKVTRLIYECSSVSTPNQRRWSLL